MPPAAPPFEIRDPIHGSVPVLEDELQVLDHPFVQRLRMIRQLGFSYLPFPGATHSRYAHSVGAMHLAGRAFDACFREHAFSSPAVRQRYRTLVRMGALLHDLGHAPFSHSTEFAMPPLRALGVDAYDPARVAARLDERATHEDYTVAILVRSSLGDVLRSRHSFGPEHVAALVSSDVRVDDELFRDEGADYKTILSQLVSSQLDVDRLDYLVRDSYYTGARYGEIDLDWLLSNLTRHTDAAGKVSLAIDGRAIYAFDDFTIARFHMFVMVYFHQKSLVYEEMLKRYVSSADCAFRLPARIDDYLEVDDVSLWSHLRAQSNPWARRIVEMRPYRIALERQGGGVAELAEARQRLDRAGVDLIAAETEGHVMGKREAHAPPIYVLDRSRPDEAPLELESATAIFDRYADERRIGRIYVADEDLPRARAVLSGVP
jgi:HD superfamily phosphohydrolase